MPRVLGLDIGPTELRYAVLRTSLRGAEMVSYGRVEMSRDTELKTAVLQLSSALGEPPDRIVMALPGTDVSLRWLEMPAVTERQLGDALPFELESELPFALSDVVLEHQVVRKQAGKLRVVAAAAASETVQAFADRVRAAGIEPQEIAPGALALEGLATLVPALRSKEPLLLIDFGATSTDVCVLASGHAEFARTLSASMTHPEELKLQLRQSMVGYRAAGGEAVTRACIGGAALARAAWPVRAELEFALATRVEEVELPDAPGAAPGDRIGYLRAAALAGRTGMRGRRTNLLLDGVGPQSAGSILREHVRTFAICGAVVGVALLFSMFARWKTLSRENQDLHARLGSVTRPLFGEELTALSVVEKRLRDLAKDRDPVPRFDAYDVLDTLSARIPDTLTHDARKLVVELDPEGRPGHFELQGLVANIEARDQLVTELSSHECFRDLEKGRTTPAVGEERITYQLEATIMCPGDNTAATRKKTPKRGASE